MIDLNFIYFFKSFFIDDEFLEVHLDFEFFVIPSSHYQRLHIGFYMQEFQIIYKTFNIFFISGLVHIYL